MDKEETASGLPLAIETMLTAAAHDPNFARHLREDRATALRWRGYHFSPSQQALLDAVPDAQLDQILTHLGEVTVKPQLSTLVTGSRPDRPSPSMAPAGVRPDELPPPVTGHRGDLPPDLPGPIRGSRPGCIVAAAVAAAALVGGGALLVTHGVRPDAVPVEQPSPVVEEPPADDGGPDRE